MGVRSKIKYEDNAEMNMTPMIDVVFQLIIFFVVCTEVGDASLEILELPKANQCQIEAPRDEGRKITVNVRPDGKITVYGEFQKPDQLENLIRFEGVAAGQEDNPTNPKLPSSKLMIILRGDANARFEAISHVFDAASKAGVYKVVIMAAKEEIQ